MKYNEQETTSERRCGARYFGRNPSFNNSGSNRKGMIVSLEKIKTGNDEERISGSSGKWGGAASQRQAMETAALCKPWKNK